MLVDYCIGKAESEVKEFTNNFVFLCSVKYEFYVKIFIQYKNFPKGINIHNAV